MSSINGLIFQVTPLQPAPYAGLTLSLLLVYPAHWIGQLGLFQVSFIFAPFPITKYMYDIHLDLLLATLKRSIYHQLNFRFKKVIPPPEQHAPAPHTPKTPQQDEKHILQDQNHTPVHRLLETPLLSCWNNHGRARCSKPYEQRNNWTTVSCRW